MDGRNAERTTRLHRCEHNAGVKAAAVLAFVVIVAFAEAAEARTQAQEQEQEQTQNEAQGQPSADAPLEEPNGSAPETPLEKVEPRPTFRAPPPNLYIKPPGAGHRLGRIGVELMMSVLAEAMGGVTGAMVGCASVEYGPQGCLLGFLIGALIGAVIGVPAGVVIGGYLMDGDGAIAATVAGGLAGVALSAALVGLVTYNLNADTTLAIVSGVGFILMPNLLAILAFELTSHQSRRYHELTTPMKLTVVPTLGNDRVGAALALSF